MNKALIIGASGLIGNYLLQGYTKQGYQVVGTSNQQCVNGLIQVDIADRAAVADLISRICPQHIVITAAYTNVDECERNPEIGWRVNVDGVNNVVVEACKIGARVIFFSTDYVFDGHGGPYAEHHMPRPINQYGQQKWHGEQIVAGLLPDNHLIVRTTVVYGFEFRPRNFVLRLVASNRAGQVVRVPRDQVGSPSYAPNVADVVVELDTRGYNGIYHVAGTNLMDRHEFAMVASEVFDLDASLIEPIDTASLGQAAARPLRAGLLVDKTQSCLRSTSLLTAREGLQRLKHLVG